MSKKNKNKETKDTSVNSIDAESGSLIIDGLEDAIAYFNGDETKAVEAEHTEFGQKLIDRATKVLEILKSEAVTEPSYTCADAARRFIVGYKDHWLHGVEAHIKSHNAPLTGTESYFKTWFKSWGAQVK